MSEDQILAEREPLLSVEDLEHTAVYPIMHMINQDVIHYIDTPLSYDALTAPDLTYTLVRPLEEKYNDLQQKGNKSVVFCFLLNRVHFLRDQNLASAPLSRSRAELCEILAIRTLRAHGTGDNILQRTVALTTSWGVYYGADNEVLAMVKADDEDPDDRVGNAIELAIIGHAKRFIKSSATQKVINSIWSGKCVYQAVANHSILPDNYKRTPVHFYDPHKAPLLDHYRLKVPAIRSVIEYTNFLVLFLLFVWALEKNEERYLNIPELIFMVYGFGFALEKVASMQEHGIRVYFTGTWNGFDLAFVTLFLTYAGLRLYGVFKHHHWALHTGIDVLAMIAPIVFPRLVFVTLQNNLLVLSLRAMLVQFVLTMVVSAFCFAGFLYALWTLSRNRVEYGAGQIGWWMLDLWFGLDASGFDMATKFHPIFGPTLMVTYACLSNTLLLTVLVSILSHTFATVNEDASAESMFRHAVSTIEGVKSSPVFAFSPPFNLAAICVMLPASYILTDRWRHKVNVFMIRLLNFPLLLGIAWYERQSKRNNTSGFYDTISVAAERAFDSLPRSLKRLTIFDGLAGSGGDIDTIFEIEALRTSAISDHDEDDIDERTPMQAMPTQGARYSPGVKAADLASSPTRPPRHRATSLLTKPDAAQQFLSPLAQVFAIPEAITEAPEPSGSGPTGPLSYGITTRKRRQSSAGMHPRSGSGSFGKPKPEMITRSSSSAPHFAPTRNPLQGRSPRQSPRILTSPLPPLASSPELRIETVQQVQEEEGDALGGPSPHVWSLKLQGIEARQQRIESLLEQIVKGMEK